MLLPLTTGMDRKNETDFDIFTTLTNRLGQVKSSFFFLCTKAVYNFKQLTYRKLDLGCPKTM